MKDLNLVIISGRLGKDPEIRNTERASIASFSLAVGDGYKNKQGEQVDRTHWINCVSFREKLNEAVIEKYVFKGSKVTIQGTLQQRTWEDKDGNTRYALDVVIDSLFLGERPQQSDSTVRQVIAEGNNPEPQTKQEGNDDDLPF
jgi:single-strand DNA-binding protein